MNTYQLIENIDKNKMKIVLEFSIYMLVYMF